MYFVLNVNGGARADTAAHFPFQERLEQVATAGDESGEADEIGYEAGGEKQQATGENEHAVEDLFTRKGGGCELTLQPPESEDAL